MWHLAERWGRMGPSGVVVPIELTHGALGRLVGARRPTVTLALGELARDGALVRRNDGSWVLRVDSNPSAAPELSHARSGITGVTLIGAGNGTAIVVARPDGAILAERSERARAASEQQRERSQLVLERCRATRARATRIRTERASRAA
jgi:hypothetical protein